MEHPESSDLLFPFISFVHCVPSLRDEMEHYDSSVSLHFFCSWCSILLAVSSFFLYMMFRAFCAVVFENKAITEE